MSSITHLPYIYKPLPEPDAIRLATLLPSPDISAPISCTIEHTTLSRYDHDLIAQYTALSYVWGDLADTRTILVDGLELHVTANLESALRHMRDPERPFRVWADALCINQADEAEKNQQVQQMGSVYAIARQTLIYIGDGGPDVSALFERIRALRHPVVLDGESLQALSGGMEGLVRRSAWFTRVWVYQELVQSRLPWVQCGRERVKWDDLCRLASAIRGDSFSGAVSAEAEPVENVEADRVRKGPLARLGSMQSARVRFQNSARGNSEGNTLLSFLLSRRGLGATDARDMVHAHLSMVSDDMTSRFGLQVDYTKTCAQLYADVVRYYVETDKDYRILSLVDENVPSGRHLGIPSWAPDWTSIRYRDSEDPFRRTSLTKLFPISPSFSRSEDGRPKLSSIGHRIGQVIAIGNVFSIPELDDDELLRTWSPFCKEHRKVSPEMIACDEIWRHFIEVAGLQHAIPKFPIIRFTVVFEERWFFMEGGSLSRDIPVLHPLDLAFVFGLKFNLTYLASLQGDLRSTILGSRRIIDRRRLCVYRGEGNEIQLCLAPQTTKVNDVICRLRGDERTFVFREEIIEERTCFVFVGPCAIGWDLYPSTNFKDEEVFVLY